MTLKSNPKNEYEPVTLIIISSMELLTKVLELDFPFPVLHH